VTGSRDIDGALEEVLAAYASAWCVDQCATLLPAIEGTASERLSMLKGAYGSPLGRAFVAQFPDPATWPQGFQNLVTALRPPVGPGKPNG